MRFRLSILVPLVIGAAVILLWLRWPTKPPVCACCGRTSREVTRYISGPGLGICEPCVRVAVKAMEQAEPPWRLSCGAPTNRPLRTDRCSFCGKATNAGRGLAFLATGTICRDCLELCVEILSMGEAAA